MRSRSDARKWACATFGYAADEPAERYVPACALPLVLGEWAGGPQAAGDVWAYHVSVSSGGSTRMSSALPGRCGKKRSAFQVRA